MRSYHVFSIEWIPFRHARVAVAFADWNFHCLQSKFQPANATAISVCCMLHMNRPLKSIKTYSLRILTLRVNMF